MEKAFVYIGADVILTRDRDVILSADGVVLPGVGAFGDAMDKLDRYGLSDTLREVVMLNIPLLGICLGQ